jgi:3-oxoacyl-[acyl-carrier protein] reductase
MSRSLNGKVALVTGASKGIGAAIAIHLAEAGASVVVNYSSDKAGADKTVSAIAAKGGRAVAVKADLSKPDQIKSLFAESDKAFGRLDVLVNNAGVYNFAPLSDVTPENFHKHFDINVLGVLLASQEAARRFGESGGSIVNISSVVATKGMPGASVYSATKASVDAITRALAVELGPKKIRVNSVNPGLISTEGTQAGGIVNSDFEKNAVAQTPLGLIGLPDDIAPAVVFLASAESKWITGETLHVAGGFR